MAKNEIQSSLAAFKRKLVNLMKPGKRKDEALRKVRSLQKLEKSIRNWQLGK